MKKRTKSLLIAFCTMAVCGSLIAGSTYALFTSSSEVNIAVTSGQVEVTATAKDLITYSAVANTSGELEDENGAKYTSVKTEEIENGKNEVFTNKGTATLNGDVLTITNMTPGDKVTFNLDIENKSNVDIMYRVSFLSTEEHDGDNALMNVLDFSITNLPNTDSSVGFSSVDYNGYIKYVTQWQNWTQATAAVTKSTTAEATISLPLTVDNIYKNKSIDIVIAVEAVQGNASVGDNNVPTVVTAPIVSADGTVDKVAANVSVPSGVVLDTSTPLKLTVSESTAEDIANSKTLEEEDKTKISKAIQTISDAGNSSVTYDISLDGISSTNTTYVSVVLENLENDVTSVYHKGDKLTKQNSKTDETSGDGYFTTEYNSETNSYTLTIYTASFSPFTLGYKYEGGIGKEGKPYLVSTAAQLAKAASEVNENGVYIKLLNDISDASSLPTTTITGEKGLVIDLNGKTLTSTQTQSTFVQNSAKLTYENGKIVTTNLICNSSDVYSALQITSGASVNLDSVNFESSSCILYPRGLSSTVNVTNSNLLSYDAYCISTNASTSEYHNVIINLKKSIIRDIGGAGILINVPSTVKISGCEIYGARQALIVRGGSATVTDTLLEGLYDCKDLGEKFGGDVWNSERAYKYYNVNFTTDSSWTSGINVFRAPLVIGNKSEGAYVYETEVTLYNVIIKSVVNEYETTLDSATNTYVYGQLTNVYTDDNAICKTAIYAIGANNQSVTLKATNCTVSGNVVKANSLVVIDGLAA